MAFFSLSRIQGGSCGLLWCELVVAFTALPPMSVSGQTPDSYFAAAAGQSKEALKEILYNRIRNHRNISYSAVWNAHRDLWEDPANPDNLILFYSGVSFDKAAQDPGSGSVQYWNREHLWPQSFGVSSGSPRTDLFALVPANKAVNADRSNKYFDVSNPADGLFDEPSHFFAPDTSSDRDSFEPPDSRKGFVARAMFYMDTRYLELELVNTPPEPAPNTSSTRMAQLDVLLGWNRQFAPSTQEKDLNEAIFLNYQFNRNPFIDFPEFVDAIWIGHPSWGSWRLEHFSLAELLDPDISGDLADPDEDGLTNLVERARYSDPLAPETTPALRVIASDNTLSLIYQRAIDPSHLAGILVLQKLSESGHWISSQLPVSQTLQISDYTEEVHFTVPLEETSPFRFYRLAAVNVSASN